MTSFDTVTDWFCLLILSDLKRIVRSRDKLLPCKRRSNSPICLEQCSSNSIYTELYCQLLNIVTCYYLCKHLINFIIKLHLQNTTWIMDITISDNKFGLVCKTLFLSCSIFHTKNPLLGITYSIFSLLSTSRREEVRWERILEAPKTLLHSGNIPPYYENCFKRLSFPGWTTVTKQRCQRALSISFPQTSLPSKGFLLFPFSPRKEFFLFPKLNPS